MCYLFKQKKMNLFYITERNSEPGQTSKMELFEK